MDIYSFWFFPGFVVNYKLLRVSYKSMESMEIIFHSVVAGASLILFDLETGYVDLVHYSVASFFFNLYVRGHESIFEVQE